MVSGLGHLFKGIIGKMSPSHLLGLLARVGGRNFPIFIPWPPFSFLATAALLVELRRPAAHLATGEPRAGEREPWPCICGRVMHCCCRAARQAGGGAAAAELLRALRHQRKGDNRRATSTTAAVLWCKAGGGCRRTWLLINVNGEHLVFDF